MKKPTLRLDEKVRAADRLYEAILHPGDRVILRRALLAAGLLHLVVFSLPVPRFAEAPVPQREDDRVIVLRQHVPPPPRTERRRVVKRPIWKQTPLPDPAPDAPEPIREPAPGIVGGLPTFHISDDTEVLLGDVEGPLPSGLLIVGMSHFRGGKYLEAAAEFQALVDGSPSYAFGYFMIGMSLLEMDKPADAEKNLLEAIKINGARFEYQSGLATAQFEQQQYAKAIATLNTAESLAKEPKQTHALYGLRGLSYAALERWPAALEDLEQAAAGGKSAAVVERLSVGYYELRHYDKALPWIQEALRQSPKDASMQARLVDTELSLAAGAAGDSQKQRHYADALAAAEQLGTLEPASKDAHNLIGRAALGSAAYPKAEQAFRKVLALDARYCPAMINLGKTYNAMQRFADAEAALQRAIDCDPRSAVAYATLAFSQQEQRKLDAAVVSYEKSYEIKPTPAVKTAIQACKLSLERDE